MEKEDNEIKNIPEARGSETVSEKDTLSAEPEQDEEQLALSDRDIKIIVSCFMLVIFVSAMIYEMSKPESITAMVVMFAAFLIFILVTLSDRD